MLQYTLYPNKTNKTVATFKTTADIYNLNNLRLLKDNQINQLIKAQMIQLLTLYRHIPSQQGVYYIQYFEEHRIRDMELQDKQSNTMHLDQKPNKKQFLYCLYQLGYRYIYTSVPQPYKFQISKKNYILILPKQNITNIPKNQSVNDFTMKMHDLILIANISNLNITHYQKWKQAPPSYFRRYLRSQITLFNKLLSFIQITSKKKNRSRQHLYHLQDIASKANSRNQVKTLQIQAKHITDVFLMPIFRAIFWQKLKRGPILQNSFCWSYNTCELNIPNHKYGSLYVYSSSLKPTKSPIKFKVNGKNIKPQNSHQQLCPCSQFVQCQCILLIWSNKSFDSIKLQNKPANIFFSQKTNQKKENINFDVKIQNGNVIIIEQNTKIQIQLESFKFQKINQVIGDKSIYTVIQNQLSQNQLQVQILQLNDELLLTINLPKELQSRILKIKLPQNEYNFTLDEHLFKQTHHNYYGQVHSYIKAKSQINGIGIMTDYCHWVNAYNSTIQIHLQGKSNNYYLQRLQHRFKIKFSDPNFTQLRSLQRQMDFPTLTAIIYEQEKSKYQIVQHKKLDINVSDIQIIIDRPIKGTWILNIMSFQSNKFQNYYNNQGLLYPMYNHFNVQLFACQIIKMKSTQSEKLNVNNIVLKLLNVSRNPCTNLKQHYQQKRNKTGSVYYPKLNYQGLIKDVKDKTNTISLLIEQDALKNNK